MSLSRADTITLIALAITILVILSSPMYLDKAFPLPDQQSDDGAIHPLLASAPDGTNPGAQITIIEFGDYQCPYTAEMQPAMSRILLEYGDKINYLHKDLPSGSHPWAWTAAAASRCILREEPMKHKEFESLIYANQGSLSEYRLIRLASNLSIDEAALSDCLADPSIKNAIQIDIDTAAKEGVTGTPTVFIDGKPFKGIQPYAKLKLIIDSLIEIKASEAMESDKMPDTAQAVSGR